MPSITGERAFSAEVADAVNKHSPSDRRQYDPRVDGRRSSRVRGSRRHHPRRRRLHPQPQSRSLVDEARSRPSVRYRRCSACGGAVTVSSEAMALVHTLAATLLTARAVSARADGREVRGRVCAREPNSIDRADPASGPPIYGSRASARYASRSESGGDLDIELFHGCAQLSSCAP